MLTAAVDRWAGHNLVASLFLQSLLLLHRLGCGAASLLLGATRCCFGLFVLLTAGDVGLFGFAQINLTLNLNQKKKRDLRSRLPAAPGRSRASAVYQFPLGSYPVLLDLLAFLFVLLVALNQRLHGHQRPAGQGWNRSRAGGEERPPLPG